MPTMPQPYEFVVQLHATIRPAAHDTTAALAAFERALRAYFPVKVVLCQFDPMGVRCRVTGARSEDIHRMRDVVTGAMMGWVMARPPKKEEA